MFSQFRQAGAESAQTVAMESHDEAISSSRFADENSKPCAPFATVPPPQSAAPSGRRDPLSRINALRGGTARRQAMNSASDNLRAAQHQHVPNSYLYNTNSQATSALDSQQCHAPSPQPSSVVNGRGEGAGQSANDGGHQTHHHHVDMYSNVTTDNTTSFEARSQRASPSVARPHAGGGGMSQYTNNSNSNNNAAFSSVSPAASSSAPIVNFEDMPASVATRQEVGMVNAFQVPPTPPHRGGSGDGGGGGGGNGDGDEDTAADGGGEDETTHPTDDASRPKPKMLRRGDGTRKLAERLRQQKEKEERMAMMMPSSSVGATPHIAHHSSSAPPQGLSSASPSVTARRTPSAAPLPTSSLVGQQQQQTPASGRQALSSTTPRKAVGGSASSTREGAGRARGGGSTTNTDTEEEALLSHNRHQHPASKVNPPGSNASTRPHHLLTPLPSELIANYLAFQQQQKGARKAVGGGRAGQQQQQQQQVAPPPPASSPSGDAIHAHLMSVFGTGLDTSSVGGRYVDPEAADIVTVDIKEFPKFLDEATSLGSRGSSSSASDVASFIHDRDLAVTNYLDVRRMDFLSSIFPQSLNDDNASSCIARFSNGCEGFIGRDSVLKPHQYYTMVKLFEDMEES